MKKDKWNSNSTVDDRLRRFDLRCSYCRPNRGENKKHHRKYGDTKPKHKTNKRDGLVDHVCPPKCPGCGAEG